MQGLSNSYNYVVTAVHYFSQYVEAAPVFQNSAVDTYNFLFSLMCYFGNSDRHITHQSKEFVNKV